MGRRVRDRITWQTVALCAIFVSGILAVLLVGPRVMSAESYSMVLAGFAAVGGVLLSQAKPIVKKSAEQIQSELTRDTDKDGEPDWIDSTPYGDKDEEE